MLLYRGILIKLLGQRKAKGALILVIVVLAVTEGVSAYSDTQIVDINTVTRSSAALQ